MGTGPELSKSDSAAHRRDPVCAPTGEAPTLMSPSSRCSIIAAPATIRAATLLSGLVLLSACSLAGPPRRGARPGPVAEPVEEPGRASPETAGAGGGADEASPDRPPANLPPTTAAPGRTYEVFGRRYTTLASADGYRERGLASWYGDEFKGRPTASGEIFDPALVTAAHRTLPLGTWVEVTNLDTGGSIRVRINDRGPFKDPELRIIDLSYETAKRLGGVIRDGTARVEVRALTEEEVGELPGGDPG